MNVPDAWVKSVCEKLGIPEPTPEYGVFWDGDDIPDKDEPLSFSKRSDGDSDYEFRDSNGTGWEHFKAISPETIAYIKKDLGIEQGARG
jgi:hypothetical protein